MTDQPLRFAVVGVGAFIFGEHLKGLQAIDAEIVAVCDTDPGRGQPRAEELNVPFYTNHHDMLADLSADVVSVITPHPSHAPVAIDCMEAGLHVLVEKPMAEHVAAADTMVETMKKTGRLLAVNFQQRLRPEILAACKLIEAGEVGEIQFAQMSATWTRPEIYFRLSDWRGTWNGEGGGVLLNQSPHDLDLLCHVIGTPRRVVAWTPTRRHKISTEDTVHAMIEWPNGAFGYLHSSTAEAGHGASRLQIIGTGGRLDIGAGTLTFSKFESDVLQFLAESQDPYASPSMREVPVELPEGAGNHVAIYRDLQAAIREGRPPAADGASALPSLELANAMTYSHFTRSEVELPLGREAYAALLEDLRKKERESGRWQVKL